MTLAAAHTEETRAADSGSEDAGVVSSPPKFIRPATRSEAKSEVVKQVTLHPALDMCA